MNATWVGPTAAIALVVIALAFIAIAGMTVRFMLHAERETRELSEELARLRADLKPALDGMRRIAEAGTALTNEVQSELQAYLAASRRLRGGLERGVHRMRVRLADLDALYEVVHGEVQHTALDLASRLRGLRRTGALVGRVRRMLRRGRR
ncbi:MAG: DUF948 domain-containing protein [Gemmatimonadales bacterium]